MAARLPLLAPEDIRPIPVEEFQRMVAAGVFPPDDRIELIEGALVAMVPINEPHAAAVDTSADTFLEKLRRRYTVRIQGPIALKRSQPQPDLAVFLINPHRLTPPRGDEILLVLEIADTSVAFDRDKKRLMYADEEIPEYWLADLNRRTIEVYRDPVAGDYGSPTLYHDGDTIVCRSIEDFGVRGEEILGTLNR